jgi:hypothetical protein
MVRSRLLLLCLVLGGVLAGCEGDTAQSPFPETPGPTPLRLAPQTMLLRPVQMPGYQRTSDETVSAGSLADQEGDQSLAATLTADGLQMGARAQYSDPNRGGPPTPFATVISQVLFFRDALGASAYFTDEQKRRAKAPNGATLSTLGGLPLGGADAIVGLAVSVPAQSNGDPPTRALFALIRRGQLVAELLGGGNAQTATDARFADLVAAQEAQLAAQPA